MLALPQHVDFNGTDNQGRTASQLLHTAHQQSVSDCITKHAQRDKDASMAETYEQAAVASERELGRMEERLVPFLSESEREELLQQIAAQEEQVEADRERADEVPRACARMPVCRCCRLYACAVAILACTATTLAWATIGKLARCDGHLILLCCPRPRESWRGGMGPRMLHPRALRGGQSGAAWCGWWSWQHFSSLQRGSVSAKPPSFSVPPQTPRLMSPS